uniref:site-specific DNA-methyltransferase (adenine-specific) n=1 Tax=candidate division WOR-3 bacterium TaxID=2052148 RepID=A0A7C6EBB0_UNCW3
MKYKTSGKPTCIPDAFDSTVYKTERTCCAKIVEWINRIIEDNHLDFGPAEVETRSSDDRYPDIIIYAKPRTDDLACVMEFKRPYFDPFNEEELKEPARKKATHRHAPYFTTSNFQELVWWSTTRVNEARREEEQIVNRYHLSQIEDLNQIDEFRFKESIKKGLESFILKLYSVSTGSETEPAQAIDEFLIYRLQDKIRRLTKYYRQIIEDRCHKEDKFAKELQRWFIEQGWSFYWHPLDYDKAARQTAYLLVNKIIFYNVLQTKRPDKLDPLQIPEGLTKGGLLQKHLQAYFEEVLKIEYRNIYSTDFIDSTAFPDNKEVVEEIKDLVGFLRRYNFATLGYDIIGRIFEKLIPKDERRNLGQYFTNPDVVDIILRFCLKHEEDKVFDPACGAGTFLVRAYQHKKLMNQYLEHEAILETLWGNDIAKFPATLATINLAINDLGAVKNYPNIMQEDFFSLLSAEEGFELPSKWRRARAVHLDIGEKEVTYPRWFDCIVGNPPYTRQEKIGEIFPEDEAFKKRIIQNALLDARKKKKIAEISKRAGIYAYFFVHGFKFLKEGGRFGFIVSNSWLDVEYGKGLQEFFLKNYKIITIIESKVERWFEEADINTCIVILERCSDAKERDNNLVRFVYLKKPLRYFVPEAKNMWEREIERRDAIDKLVRTIKGHNEFYENEDLRIFPKSQKELWGEGFSSEEQRYVGSKWGKYLRAPEIFFKILEKGKGKLVPLKEVADVRRGYIPWPYDIFRLKKEDISRLNIQDTYFYETMSSPTECDKIIIDRKVEFPYYLLIVNDLLIDIKDKNLKAYLKKMAAKVERAKKSPNDWFVLEKRKPYPIIYPRTPYNRHIAFLNMKGISVIDHIEIAPDEDAEVVASILNSTIYILFREIFGRTGLGGGTLKVEVIDMKALPFLISKSHNMWDTQLTMLLNKLNQREIRNVENELGASSPEEVSLDKVKPDRRELDKIIMGEILGLTDEEQLEVYRAVIDLVKSRIERAKSVGAKHKTKEGIDIDMLVKIVMDKIGAETLGKFYQEKILSQKNLVTRTIPQPATEISAVKRIFGWSLKIGKRHIDCDSEEEAKYLKILAQTGLGKIKIPKDQKYLKKILPELETMKKKMDKVINEYLASVLDRKLKEKLHHYIWQEIMK